MREILRSARQRRRCEVNEDAKYQWGVWGKPMPPMSVENALYAMFALIGDPLRSSVSERKDWLYAAYQVQVFLRTFRAQHKQPKA